MAGAACMVGFRGFDSSIILSLKGWNSHVHRGFPGKGWNSHVHRGFPGKFESSNVSRDIHAYLTGRSPIGRASLTSEIGTLDPN